MALWGSEPEQKRAFGELWAKYPTDPYKAACLLFVGNIGMALQASGGWIYDPIAIAARDKYIADAGPAKIAVLSKEALLKKIEDMIEAVDMGTGRPLICAEDKLKAFKLYADIAGYIAKPEAVVNFQNNVDNRVMVAVDHGSNGQWEENLRAQQRKLLADARN